MASTWHTSEFIVPTTITFHYKFLNIGIGIVPAPSSCYFVQRKEKLWHKIYDISFPNNYQTMYSFTIFSIVHVLLLTKLNLYLCKLFFNVSSNSYNLLYIILIIIIYYYYCLLYIICYILYYGIIVFSMFL